MCMVCVAVTSAGGEKDLTVSLWHTFSLLIKKVRLKNLNVDKDNDYYELCFMHRFKLILVDKKARCITGHRDTDTEATQN